MERGPLSIGPVRDPIVSVFFSSVLFKSSSGRRIMHGFPVISGESGRDLRIHPAESINGPVDKTASVRRYNKTAALPPLLVSPVPKYNEIRRDRIPSSQFSLLASPNLYFCRSSCTSIYTFIYPISSFIQP